MNSAIRRVRSGPSGRAGAAPQERGLRPTPPRADGAAIPVVEAGTLPGLFARRVAETPAAVAYLQHEAGRWREYRWREVARRVVRWQQGLVREGLRPGDRVALSLPNGVDWVVFDQAALGVGLVTVPLYTTDSPGNLAHVLADSGARLLLLDSDSQWAALVARGASLPALRRVLCRRLERAVSDDRVRAVADWLPAETGPGPGGAALCRAHVDDDPDALATLVYTSGTTGPPKGVMLSHRNVLSNAEAIQARIPAWPSDCFLSFLPLAHAFERTVGYYLPMMAGCRIAYARSIEQLREDLAEVRPTVLLSVPRVYDKIYLAIQAKLGERGLKRSLFERTVGIGWQRFEAARGRRSPPSLRDRLLWPVLRRLVAGPVLARLGGRLRVAVSGGAPLSATVGRFFVGLGLPLTEGYGLTEAAPVVTGVPPEGFIPGWVGTPLDGVEVRLHPPGGSAGELLVRGPGVCLGYWGQPEATASAIDAEGWLHTGDLAELRDGYVGIRGRLKEILVTSTGEKVPPTEMESALTMDPLIEQAMVVGEGRQYLAALLVLSEGRWRDLAAGLGRDAGALADPALLAAVQSRVDERLQDFPGYARVRAIHLTLEPWTVENGLLTPTLKLKRPVLTEHFADTIAELYRRDRSDVAPR